MLDLPAWLEKAKSFIDRLRHLPQEVFIRIHVTPPPSRSTIDRVRKQVPRALPEVLIDMYRHGFGEFECRYSWEPPRDSLRKLGRLYADQRSIYGGPCFVSYNKLAQTCELGRVWADEVCAGWEGDEGAAARELWHRSIPFIALDNGDRVALDVASDFENPSVVYLSHDDAGFNVRLSDSLESFLLSWEQIAYVGPESWMLSPFLDPETLALGPDRGRARQLRDLLEQSSSRCGLAERK